VPPPGSIDEHGADHRLRARSWALGVCRLPRSRAPRVVIQDVPALPTLRLSPMACTLRRSPTFVAMRIAADVWAIRLHGFLHRTGRRGRTRSALDGRHGRTPQTTDHWTDWGTPGGRFRGGLNPLGGNTMWVRIPPRAHKPAGQEGQGALGSAAAPTDCTDSCTELSGTGSRERTGRTARTNEPDHRARFGRRHTRKIAP
jgi:hypothetical protein